MAGELPIGTVTFLFTDIEGSSLLAQLQPEAWERLRSRHDAILRSEIEEQGGYVFQVVGDACCAAFDTVASGLTAAIEIQRALQDETWGAEPLRVRMGLHTGEARAVAGDYHGYLTLARATRVMSSAHGGQILLSNSSAELVRAGLPDEMSLRDLGKHRLRGLPGDERIWQVVAPGLWDDFPPLASVGTAPHNLPVQLTSFVGRERELNDVGDLLRVHRLVTLTGAGGTGKTRLALQFAAETVDDFRDGAWLVELAPLSDPALLPNTAASALDVRAEQGRPLMTTLLEWLENRELWMALDNCEHLIDACARLADIVLHASTGVRILATSREALGIAGEWAYHVPSLECPKPGQAPSTPLGDIIRFPAVELFAERAMEAVAGFRLSDANVTDVVQICNRLDGIPLAIELAAARVKVLGVGQIAARLDDRFRLLTGGGRTTLPRHQTLRSLIDWSYSLLSDPERMLLRRLSTFAGGWTLEAAEHMCANTEIDPSEVLDLLAHLVDKSLVTTNPASAEARYSMFETIRQYALEKLIDAGQAEEARGQQLLYMQELAQDVAAGSFHLAEAPWYDRMDIELDNLRAAVEWAPRLENPEPALKLAGSLLWFWFTRGHWYEARRWLEEALERNGAGKRTQGRAWALTALGFLQIYEGEYESGHLLLEESASISREIGDRHSLVMALAWHGSFAGLWGDYIGGARVLGEALELSREFHYILGMGLSLVGLGNLKAGEGNDSEAQSYCEEGATYLQQAGDMNMLAWARRRLGYVALRKTEYARAYALCSESLRLNRGIRDTRGMCACLAAIGSIAVQQGHAAAGARLYGASAALLEEISAQLVPIDVAELQPHLLTARRNLGEEGYQRAFSEGRAMTMEQAVAFALEQCVQAPDAEKPE